MACVTVCRVLIITRNMEHNNICKAYITLAMFSKIKSQVYTLSEK